MASSPLKLVIAGASGRMGRMLIEAVLKAPDLVLHAATDRAGSPAIGQDAGTSVGQACGVAIGSDMSLALQGAQVLIDFTRPAATLEHASICRDRGVAMVIGTTGLSPEDKAELARMAQSVPMVLSPNMSVGVNVVLQLLAQAAKALDEGYDIEIIEAHHRHKADAPSGTALAMGEAVATATGRDLASCAVYGREGITGERDPRTIGFATIRGGDIVGDHTVLFAGTGERIEISHKSSSRATYAQGSLRAARFLAGRAPGLYSMQDVLGMAPAPTQPL